ncbi:MAG: hypothetical protein HZA53_16570 [Planctomycetes bacterium]|nr:hypothetical protein [Planctomycetota bacterium]
MLHWLQSSLLALAPLVQSPVPPKPADAPATTALDRVAVLGASLSEGFGLEPEIGAPVWIGDVVRAAAKRELPAPNRQSSLLFFTAPRVFGPKAAKEALATQPTLVLALDWLFWFGYGAFDSDAKRLESFEFGLKQLEPFTCPVLLGDLPDMRGALTGVPQMLDEKQVPAAAALAVLNERLKAWSKERANVVVFPLSEFAAKLSGKDAFTLRGNSVFASELPELLQKDKLHPTVMGTIVTWIAAADALVRARKDVPATWFEWDRQQIYRRLYASQEAARAAKRIERQKQYEKDHPPPPPPDPAEQARKKRAGDGDGEDAGKGG